MTPPPETAAIVRQLMAIEQTLRYWVAQPGSTDSIIQAAADDIRAVTNELERAAADALAAPPTQERCPACLGTGMLHDSKTKWNRPCSVCNATGISGRTP
jgi:hypothetical protein